MTRFILALSLAALPAAAQYGAKNGEWHHYGGDLGQTRYSPLSQIDASNFNNLELAWSFKTANLGPRPEFNLQATPLMAKGVLYTTAGTRRAAVALDAATGELLWTYSLNEGQRGDSAPRRLSGRGLAYWTDGKEERILYVTPGYRLIALNAKTGALVPNFGQGGMIDLKQEDDQEIDPVTGEVGLHATPTVAGDTVVVGAAHLAGNFPKSKRNVKGYVRGFDVRTGKRMWIFHTIPKPGEFGYDSWEKDSADYTGNTGVWGQMAVDEQLGLIYLPVELPTGDYYGGHRPGNGLFGESIVALDYKTGKRRWHYQTVHHGIWDMDIPCAPVLTDITINGRTVKALAQPTKQSILYVLNRENGQPIWPTPEVPVPQSDVQGEKTSATQPMPTKPPAYGRNGFSMNDIIDFTPALKAEGEKVAANYRIGPIFTPPVESKLPAPIGTLAIGLSIGGTNWAGGSYDPETHIFYVFSQGLVGVLGLVRPNPGQSDMDWIMGRARPAGAAAPGRGGAAAGGGRGGPGRGAAPADVGGEGGGGGGPNVQGLSLLKPPYGSISAIDLNKGEIVWQIAHGETPDNIKNHPALKGIELPRTGRPGVIGTLVTKTLVIAGEGGFATTPAGRGAMLRAYDKSSGKEVGAVYMPAPQTGSPMTYAVRGEQYIVVGVSGPGAPGQFLAYRLPPQQ
jgi:quinoprotein glucose dehydrogenase